MSLPPYENTMLALGRPQRFAESMVERLRVAFDENDAASRAAERQPNRSLRTACLRAAGIERRALDARLHALKEIVAQIEEVAGGRAGYGLELRRAAVPQVAQVPLDELTADDPDFSLVGYASVFPPAAGSETTLQVNRSGQPVLTESVAQGAFDEALADVRSGRSNVVGSLAHSQENLPLCSTHAATLRLSVDSRGLRFAMRLSKTVSFHNDVRQLVERGELRGSSIGFICIVDELSPLEGRGGYHRTLKRLALRDIAVCPVGAYPGAFTQIVGQTQPPGQRNRLWQAAERRVSAADVFTDARWQQTRRRIDALCQAAGL